MATEGSLTIKKDGEIIGGLGIAGGTADEDQQIAEEVLASLGYELEFAAWGVAGKPAPTSAPDSSSSSSSGKDA